MLNDQIVVTLRVTLPDGGGSHEVKMRTDRCGNPYLHWDEVAALVEAGLPKLADAVAAVYGSTQPAVPQSRLASTRAIGAD